MAALTPEMTAAADTAGISAPFRAFLVAQEILRMQDFGLLAATEPEIAKEILEVAAAGGVESEWKEKVAVKKLWLVCRKALDEGSGRKKEVPGEPDAPLTDEDVKEIKQLWSRVHGFVIPEAWILSPGLCGRLSRDVTSSPPRLEVILAESLRPRSCVEKTPGAMFQTLVPGKQTETHVIIADAVTRPIELYLRCRAYFVSIAYVSIKHPQFFDFQSALFASDKILGFVTQSFKGQFAPMTFYIAAWAATIHHWCEEVRLHSKTLNEVVKNTGEWEHKWTNFTPSSDGSVGRDANVDLPKPLRDEVEAMKLQVKDWQAKYNSSQDEFRNFKKNHIADKYHGGKNTGDKGDNKGGNGYGKGSKGGDGGRKRERDEYAKDQQDRRVRSPNRSDKRRGR
jgi:hypothetical protein